MAVALQTFQHRFIRHQGMLGGGKVYARHGRLAVQHIVPGTAGDGHDLGDGARINPQFFQRGL